MKRTLSLLAMIATSHCGASDRGLSFELPSETRDLGHITVGDLDLHLEARTSGQHAATCEPTWGPSRACTFARVTVSIDARRGDQTVEPHAYDSGWIAGAIITVADRDTGSTTGIIERSHALLTSLRVVSCSDASHLAYRIEANTSHYAAWWSLMSVLDGALVGFNVNEEGVSRCDDVLRKSAEIDARYANDTTSGDRRPLEVMVRSGERLDRAIDYTLDRTFTVDALRERLPLLTDVLLERLTVAMPRDEALAAHLLARLASPEAAFPEGTRGSRPLDEWVRKLVRTQTAEQKRRLADSLDPLCARASTRCPAWRSSALLEALSALPDTERCPRAGQIVARRLVVDRAGAESHGLALADALVGCTEANAFARDVLSAPQAFVARDETFLFPPCLSTITMESALGRCRSLPTYAVMIAQDACEPSTLAAARIAGASPLRPWQVGALAVFHRCHRDDELRALTEALRPLPRFREDGVRQEFEHDFPAVP